MELYDFLEFEPFNRLRELMGTDQLGQFELFDPDRHLTGDERSVLARQGLQLPRSMLGRLLDHCLCYKNSRVAIVDEDTLHLANCDQFPDRDQYRVGTSEQAFDAPTVVCSACLQVLNYQGYDEQKARKEYYNRQVLQQFSLEAFWSDYVPYPLNRDREKVKPIDRSEGVEGPPTSNPIG
ncbi:hypothetical protein [Saccharospirillum impatiens]|uniref:hypothetical protein n=1 Tax=Saccharospirillum impatiens TaxID=169438 RepID=UPI00040EB3B8|nr:hypothetical protein [Saccharospirillum impatiens]